MDLDSAEAVNAEIRDLFAAGADVVQETSRTEGSPRKGPTSKA